LRLYFAPNGLGLGHIRRTEAIARRFEQDRHRIIYSTYLDGSEYARREGLPLVEALSLTYRVKGDGTVDYKATVASSGLSLGIRKFLRQLGTEIRRIRRFRPDIILSDSRLSPILAGRLLGIPVILLINQLKVEIVRKPSAEKLTPLSYLFFFVANIFWIFMSRIIEWAWSLSEVILVPDFPPPYTICLQNLELPPRHLQKAHFIGPIVEVNPGDLPKLSALRRRHALPDKPLVYAAISGPKIERRILSSSLESLFPSLPEGYQFILTKGEPDGERVLEEGNVRTYSWVDDRTQYEFMKAADIIISRAGHGIITKSMVYGKKMILIPIPDHTEQWNNARVAQRLGVARIVQQEKLDRDVLSNAIRHMIYNNVSSSVQEVYRESAKLDALDKAAEWIYHLARE